MESKIVYPELKCPECDGKDFLIGPRGGVNRNILCVNCWLEWNYGPFGFNPIIPARPELYGL
jgi:hypothetical protein